MRYDLPSALSLALVTSSALADTSVNVTSMGGSVGAPFDNGQVHGFSYNFPEGGGAGGGPPFNLYDNIPTFLGGTSKNGHFGPFDTFVGTYLFLDWKDDSAQWGDDLHQISAGGAGPAVVTGLWYSYRNTVATSTHTIKIYDMVPPSVVPSITVSFSKGMLLTSIVLTNLPAGDFFSVSVTGLSVHLPQSSVWIKFGETGPGAPGTYWLTGGLPGIGSSHDGVTQTRKYPGGYAYNLWLPYDYFTMTYGITPYYAESNITVGLNGYHIPAPATIGVLGLGGLLALRRWRIG